jgi:hypothetical protein
LDHAVLWHTNTVERHGEYPDNSDRFSCLDISLRL